MTTFPERLAYLAWLRHLTAGECPTNTDIGNAVGLGQSAISQWWGRPTAPEKIDILEALIAYFEIAGHMEWLRKGTGDVPRPKLWAEWWENAERRREQKKLTERKKPEAKKAQAPVRGRPATKNAKRGPV